MTDERHTPGLWWQDDEDNAPWSSLKLVDGAKIILEAGVKHSDDGGVYAVMHGSPKDKAKIGAVNDLLQACKHLDDWLKGLVCGPTEEEAKARAILKAAIKKAEPGE